MICFSWLQKKTNYLITQALVGVAVAGNAQK